MPWRNKAGQGQIEQNINPEQIRVVLQWLLGAGGPLAAVFIAYQMPPDKIAVWTNLIIAVVPPAISAIWAFIRQRNKNRITSVSQIPDVEKVVTKDKPADAMVAQVAQSDAAPKVMTAIDAKVETLQAILPDTPMRTAAIVQAKKNGGEH